MNEKEKKEYLAKYKKEKENGVPFFPDIILKDAVVSLIIFIILASLAYFIGVKTDARANPADTSYTPRPEWYFLFLFQLLKYFPGKLEVIGVIIIPTLVIATLLALPFFDKSPKRFFLNRPVASIAGLVLVAGIGLLTILAVVEAPPPQVASVVDQAAELYLNNCANCHGETINVPLGTDLHQLIASGSHEGMPAWGGDLSTTEIDELAGFILSPNGSEIYTEQCSICHEQIVSAAGDPIELQRVVNEGINYPWHSGLNIPNWSKTLSSEEIDALLNFLAAPDGQRLFAINCSGCHGSGVTFSGTEGQLKDLISRGGQHLTMPAWQSTLASDDLETLAEYVTDPSKYPSGNTLFDKHCVTCHGEVIPSAPDLATALQIISKGGPHVTMPVWGDILTSDQLDALANYAFETSQGQGGNNGEKLFSDYCSACHGQYGQGGPNPMRPGDYIVSISSSDFLNTRDDSTIRNIIAQGQPDSGMPPFGSSFGGSLDDTQLDALVAFIRAWQTNPPPELPTATPASVPTAGGGSVGGDVSYSLHIVPVLQTKCQACHNTQINLGGWDASSYLSVTTSGDNGPVIIAGDAANSLLIQKLLGQSGAIMPPSGSLAEDVIQYFIDWINAGALNN